jgi:hypothetical protein
MFSGQQLSGEEVVLVLELIVFARSNDFFQSEFDDEDTCAHYVHLQEIAGGLDQRLTQVQESVDELDVRTVGPSRGDAEATEIVPLNGKTCLTAPQQGAGSKVWWDLSNIKPSLTRDSIHRQVGQVVDQLGELSSCSDCLDDRQRLQEAIFLLKPMAEIAQ